MSKDIEQQITQFVVSKVGIFGNFNVALRTILTIHAAILKGIVNPESDEISLILKDKHLDSNKEIDLESLEFFIKIYLYYLVWKFPNKKIEPFILIGSIPKEMWEFVIWFVFVIFIQVNKELGELFNGQEELDKNWLSYVLELSPHLKGQRFDINEYLDKKYYFSTISVQFT